MNSKTYSAIGVSDFKSYFLKYFLPIFLIDFFILFVFLFAFKSSAIQWLGIALFFLVLVFIFSYPMILIDNQSRDIEENLHFFITYAGALSTVNLERKELFVLLSEKTRYLEISKIFKKLIYLVDSIKLDFSTAAYKVSSILNTEHFSRFLERMGIALSFNANVGKFLLEEQKALINSYEVVYREGLERIKMVQEMFTSLILAFSFMLATVLLIPFMTGIDSNVFLQFGILAIILLDAMMIVFAKFFIPKDNLYHNMGYEEGRQKILILFIISTAIALILIPIIFFLDIPIMLKIAIVSTPYLIVGMYSNYQEKIVWNRDVLFPPFIRSLGDVHQSKGGTLTTTVETLLPHNFGILNQMLERVYKRLKITSDKFNSWHYFAKESGSALIAEFMDIFVSVVYRGGSAQVAGEIVSDNMSRINGLRDQKREFSSTLKSGVYGTFFGLSLVIYISLLISVLLMQIFASLTEGLDGMAMDLVGDIFPTTDITVDFVLSTYYVAAILTIHALISGYMVKEVDGGNKFSMFTDVVIMLWIGALLEIGITAMFKSMFSSYFGAL